jgi:hypothetical protein
MGITVIGGGGGGAGPRGPKGDPGDPGPGADQSLNTADSVTFKSLTLSGEAGSGGSGVSFPDATTQESAGITSVTGGVNGTSRITNCIAITQADYDALSVKDPSTIYVIL